MIFENKHIVITGGASGIGAELAKRASKAGGKVVVADLNLEAAQAIADEIGGLAVQCDVADEGQILTLVEAAQEKFGAIDMFCSNAGLAIEEPDHAASADNATWTKNWNVHVMSHVYAARAVLPSMLERGEGYLVNMASAAGLLSQIGNSAYSATKHAAVGFAESLAITHGDDGIKVSVICPQYVATPLTGYKPGEEVKTPSGTITVKMAVDAIVQGIQEERFLILTHPEVETFMQHKTADYNRWVGGMRKMRRGIIEQIGTTDLNEMHKIL